ncbi:Mth938-like domain-containing protein [Natronospira bacteriovora]|uniref:Mth938-like domain-containing protein n=1 Tax=Natronospira bacteriovora TaxID=3069753 RepID=A0ABU0W5J4_9GAMM|nr:Mth938-like domain-containing protein [Natronospira sp. AB-CW4]MDQ2068310.1 Mth938-like domain-containing protein [Natronospira sp. AB-CW4]
MKVEKDFLGDDARLLIRAYGPGEVRVNNDLITQSFILTPFRLDTGWRPEQFNELQPGDFDAMVAERPEVILLGTGARTRIPRQEILAAVLGQGIGLEFMDTGAACRTFNVLVAEERSVMAGLLMIEDEGEPD